MDLEVSLDRLSCTQLKGVGPRLCALLKKINITTIQDLLFHLPLRYEDRTKTKPLRQLRIGDKTLVEGEIMQGDIQNARRKNLLCKIYDGTGYLNLRFFHFNTPQYQALSKIGQRLYCYGEIRRGAAGLEMIHPEYSLLKEGISPPIENKLTPIYPITEGFGQHTLRKLMDQALELLSSTQLKEYLPNTLLEKFALPDLISAIHMVHHPKVNTLYKLNAGLHPAQQRLSFEELLAHQLSLLKIRLKKKSFQAPNITPKESLVRTFKNNLPYSLTNAQEKVITEIVSDIKSKAPMLRLLQGDVGSGKTVVAALIALYVIESGYQVAVMAPTELLAEQHYKNFSNWYESLQLSVAWLTGRSKEKMKTCALKRIKEGEAHIVIGTHALFQSKVEFQQLGLIIIDEQHRFGVDQRLALLNKGCQQTTQPHQLVMSATPIPRTLAMTAYADLDCSIIDQLPPGRIPVTTIVLPNIRRQQLISRIQESCLVGAQVYWVCTLIEESELLQCQAAEKTLQELTVCLPGLKVGLIHGRMKSEERIHIMQAFKNKEIALLVATTVIEVGVDVPNASLMVIENSERLGLSQLHQLRGRVGRGSAQSHCILLYRSPLSKPAQERLNIMRSSNDGFAIAEKDLELRGPGEVLGTKQTGLISFKIANLLRDQHQLPSVQRAAEILIKEYPIETDLLIQRWLADNTRFSEV